MSIEDDAVEVRAQGWRTLAALHGRIETVLERALQSGAFPLPDWQVQRPVRHKSFAA